MAALGAGENPGVRDTQESSRGRASAEMDQTWRASRVAHRGRTKLVPVECDGGDTGKAAKGACVPGQICEPKLVRDVPEGPVGLGIEPHHEPGGRAARRRGWPGRRGR